MGCDVASTKRDLPLIAVDRSQPAELASAHRLLPYDLARLRFRGRQFSYL